VVRGRLIAVLAGSAALAAAPSCALAQNGFPDYRQAAADQYPQQPPPGNTGPGGNPGGGNEQTGGSSGNPRPVHHAYGNGHRKGGSHHGASNGIAPAGAQSTAPVAVPTRPVPAAKGSLPFTGSDLSGLVVLALILIAAGLFAGALARATRRRRRHAPA
jgi:hypothetical protein